jgi:hypothetical protein
VTAIKKPEIVAEPLFLEPFVPTALRYIFYFDSETGEKFGQVSISVVYIFRESEINHSRDLKGVHPNSNSFFIANREKQGFTQGHPAFEFAAKATHRKATNT